MSKFGSTGYAVSIHVHCTCMYDAVNFFLQLSFVLPLFLGMVMYDNEIVWFQKISIPPPRKGFFLRPPTPLENPIKLLTFP